MRRAVLFVCLGNICRSPTAQAVFQHKVKLRGLADRIVVDSAGTGDWHVGSPPDRRALAAARSRGYDMSDLRARQVSVRDFMHFDYILAMDNANLRDLESLRPVGYGGEVDLFLRYCKATGVLEVPDPYYGGESGFESVLDLIEDASEGLLERILDAQA